jgi:hypothetical protein
MQMVWKDNVVWTSEASTGRPHLDEIADGS